MFWKKYTPVMTPEELIGLLDAGQAPVLVDVRSEKDYQKAHLPGAINIPLAELEQRAGELNPAAPTVFY
jgi:rhodanese-related sulfurtransferase